MMETGISLMEIYRLPFSSSDVGSYVIVRSRIRAVYRKYTRTFVYSSGFPNKPDSIRDLTILYHHVRVQFEFGLYATIRYYVIEIRWFS